ncbi:hypothetical protein D049_3167A, partial [Vibrio parahaemolyticus VPTS-2010]
MAALLNDAFRSGVNKTQPEKQ